MEQTHFSIRQSLAGHAVFLTGATGYIGSLVLEQLLRCCPDISVVYVLVRDRKGDAAELRIRRLLHSGLFSRVRDQPHLLSKVCLVKGDLSSLSDPSKWPQHATSSMHPSSSTESLTEHCPLPSPTAPHPVCHSKNTNGCATRHVDVADVELGRLEGGYWDAEGSRARMMTLSELAKAQGGLHRLPLVVLHCAARITLEDPIKVTLKENYVGTQRLLQFARGLPGVVGFVHVSSAYVNVARQFLPEGTVHEAFYSYRFGDTEVDHVDVVSRILAMDDRMSEARCAYLCTLWGLPNSYVLGKHLTEQLVRDAHRGGLPVAIVRPSLVGAVAGKPYPGYVGNLAGPSGAAVAWVMGFFGKHGNCLTAWNHLDCIPGDVASSLIIAAAAGLLSGYDTSTGQLNPSTGANQPAAPATPSKSAVAGACSSTSTSSATPAESPSANGVSANGVSANHVLATGVSGEQTPVPGVANAPVAIYHAASSTINPISHFEAAQLADGFYRKHKPGVIKLGRNMASGTVVVGSVPWKAKLARRWLGVKVNMARAFLECFGQDTAARRLRQGHLNFVQQVQCNKNNHRLFFDVSHVLALERLLPPEEREDFPIIWRGDWIRYAHTYMAAVLKLFLGKRVPQSTDHDFVHIPSRHVA